MALSTLGELKSSIADWLNREDLTTVIPDFILMAESRINSDFRSRIMVNEYEASTTYASEEQQNPLVIANAYEVMSLVVDGKVIPYVTYEHYRREREGRNFLNGCWTFYEGNIYYSDWAAETEAAPASGGDSQDVTVYSYDISSFDFGDDASVTALFTESPELFLYASLVEASVYLRDPEFLQVYQVRYDELLDKLYKSYKRRQVSGGMAVTSVGGDYLYQRTAT